MQNYDCDYRIFNKFVRLLILLSMLLGCSPSPISPTRTPIPPTQTPIPPTHTPVPPSVTPIPPTRTSVPPTQTHTPTKTYYIPPTRTPEPTSCDEVEGICLELTYDGEHCTYKGPTEFKSGTVTLLYINESDVEAYVNMVRHLEDKTVQDMIDYLGEEPSHKHYPLWSVEIQGVWYGVYIGMSHTWVGDLEPGIHTMVCVTGGPIYNVWFGGGFTVED